MLLEIQYRWTVGIMMTKRVEKGDKERKAGGISLKRRKE